MYIVELMTGTSGNPTIGKMKYNNYPNDEWEHMNITNDNSNNEISMMKNNSLDKTYFDILIHNINNIKDIKINSKTKILKNYSIKVRTLTIKVDNDRNITIILFEKE